MCIKENQARKEAIKYKKLCIYKIRDKKLNILFEVGFKKRLTSIRRPDTPAADFSYTANDPR